MSAEENKEVVRPAMDDRDEQIDAVKAADTPGGPQQDELSDEDMDQVAGGGKSYAAIDPVRDTR